MRARYLVASLLPLLLFAIILQGACPPHTHTDFGAGLFNADHDLTLFATTRTVGQLAGIVILFVSFSTAPLVLVAPTESSALAAGGADSRAPPVA
jgi:hypothetical protein